MPTYHKQLAALLADIDGVITEARSHVDEPDGIEPDERVRAAKVLVDMCELRDEVEGKLRGE